MATLKNKRKLAAVSRETQEHSRNSQSQNTFVPGITEEYITQISEQIKGRVTKKLSQEFSRLECSILGALSKLDEFLLNPQARTLSGTVSGTSRNNELENWEPTGDRSQSNPHLEVVFSTRKTSNSDESDPEETSHNLAVAQFGNIGQSIEVSKRNFPENFLTGCYDAVLHQLRLPKCQVIHDVHECFEL